MLGVPLCERPALTFLCVAFSSMSLLLEPVILYLVGLTAAECDPTRSSSSCFPIWTLLTFLAATVLAALILIRARTVVYHVLMALAVYVLVFVAAHRATTEATWRATIGKLFTF